jgi:6-pyruvoyl-tetrahydropterin synthase-like protein
MQLEPKLLLPLTEVPVSTRNVPPVPTLTQRPIPMSFLLLVALLVHGPLLLMQLPLNSYDANFHIFFASHYLHHWFDPWNPKWYAGFSQTTYPPLPHQWMALIGAITGLNYAYMIVQFICIALLVVGVYRYAKLWVDERSASYAALGAIFLGSLALIVYQDGQLSTTASIPLYLLGLPYFYDWCKEGRFGALIKGLALMTTAAAAHHATLLFGAFLFALPVLWLVVSDKHVEHRGGAAAVGRAVIFGVLCGALVAVVLAPFWIALLHNPVKQVPIPHASRSNLLFHPIWGLNYLYIPYGAIFLAFPFIFVNGSRMRRLRPLLVGFWFTAMIGLGGTTPIGKWLLGRAYEVLTYERFTFWATLLALPFVGLLVSRMIDKYQWRGAMAAALLAIATFSAGIAWTSLSPVSEDTGLPVKDVASFLNRDQHDKYRYVTLGFGRKISQLSVLTDASTVDGEWNTARQLPELTQYGAAQFTSAKYYGTAGIESLEAMLRHADNYGLKWVFVRDPYYEPLLVFAGWRKIDTIQRGAVGIWEKDAVPPAQPMHYAFMPPPWHGLLWGTLPIGSSIFTILLFFLWPEPRRAREVVEFPTSITSPVYARGGE